MTETSPAAVPAKSNLSSMASERTRAEVGHVHEVIDKALQNLPPRGSASHEQNMTREQKEERRTVAQDEARRVDAVVRGQLADKKLTSVVPPPPPEQKKDPSPQLWSAAAMKVQTQIGVDEELEKRGLKPIDEVNAERNGASR